MKPLPDDPQTAVAEIATLFDEIGEIDLQTADSDDREWFEQRLADAETTIDAFRQKFPGRYLDTLKVAQAHCYSHQANACLTASPPQIAQALSLIDQAIQTNDDLHFRMGRAAVYEARGDKARMIAELEEALTLFPDDPAAEEVRSHLKAIQKPKSGCFIATASFGSVLHPELRVLYEFRDQVLMRSFFGRVFIALYYSLSPPLAAILRRSVILRAFVRNMLLTPLIRRLR